MDVEFHCPCGAGFDLTDTTMANVELAYGIWTSSGHGHSEDRADAEVKASQRRVDEAMRRHDDE